MPTPTPSPDGRPRQWASVIGARETADVETSSDAYARRFDGAGRARGSWTCRRASPSSCCAVARSAGPRRRRRPRPAHGAAGGGRLRRHRVRQRSRLRAARRAAGSRRAGRASCRATCSAAVRRSRVRRRALAIACCPTSTSWRGLVAELCRVARQRGGRRLSDEAQRQRRRRCAVRRQEARRRRHAAVHGVSRRGDRRGVRCRRLRAHRAPAGVPAAHGAASRRRHARALGGARRRGAGARR